MHTLYSILQSKISPNGNTTTRWRCPREMERVSGCFGVSGDQVGTVFWLVVELRICIKTARLTTLLPTFLCPDHNVRELPITVLGFHIHCRNGQFWLSLVLVFGCLKTLLPPYRKVVVPQSNLTVNRISKATRKIPGFFSLLNEYIQMYANYLRKFWRGSLLLQPNKTILKILPSCNNVALPYFTFGYLPGV